MQGFPADTITAALDQLGVKPNVVMSGINTGQNLGTLSDLSGTVGAAKMAVTRGIPAVAFSQGVGDAPQYASTAKLAVDWLAKHRAALAKKPTTAPTTIENYNVPNCPSGKSRGIKKVVTAPDANNAIAGVDCAATGPKPTTDIEAFNQGYAAVGDGARRLTVSRPAPGRRAAPSTAASCRDRCATARSRRAGCRRPRTPRARAGSRRRPSPADPSRSAARW